jgi:hypothetical protein
VGGVGVEEGNGTSWKRMKQRKRGEEEEEEEEEEENRLE